MRYRDLYVDIDSSTQYATVYRGERPVATMQRRRVLERGDENWNWKLYLTDGSFVNQFNLPVVALIQLWRTLNEAS